MGHGGGLLAWFSHAGDAEADFVQAAVVGGVRERDGGVAVGPGQGFPTALPHLRGIQAIGIVGRLHEVVPPVEERRYFLLDPHVAAQERRGDGQAEEYRDEQAEGETQGGEDDGRWTGDERET